MCEDCTGKDTSRNVWAILEIHLLKLLWETLCLWWLWRPPVDKRVPLNVQICKVEFYQKCQREVRKSPPPRYHLPLCCSYMRQKSHVGNWRTFSEWNLLLSWVTKKRLCWFRFVLLLEEKNPHRSFNVSADVSSIPLVIYTEYIFYFYP